MGRLIALCLHHRDHYSTGHYRQVFDYEAFHWSIMIMSEDGAGDCHVYDATDTSNIDWETFRLTNPTMDWWFRSRENFDPTPSSKLIGRIVIGEVPDDDGLTGARFRDFFGNLPLPVRNREPQESCVTWAVSAILALQEKGWVRPFDIERFKDWALAYGDDRVLGEGSERPDIVQYRMEE